MGNQLERSSTGEFIDPATEDLQRELLEEFGRNSRRSTNDLVFQKLTLGAANTVGTPEVSHGCNSVKIMTAATTVYIDDAEGDVTRKNVLLIQNIWLDLPINQVSNLRFLGGTGGEVVYLISSN